MFTERAEKLILRGPFLEISTYVSFYGFCQNVATIVLHDVANFEADLNILTHSTWG